MTEETEAKISLFALNAQVFKKDFGNRMYLAGRLAALLYAQENKTVDCGAVRQCYDFVIGTTGAFSAFRGNMSLCIAALMSQTDKPAHVFSRTLRVYELLRSEKLRATEYLAAAAYQIAAGADSDRYSAVVERARAFYKGVVRLFRFTAGPGDYIFAAMLGLSDFDVDKGLEHIERIYSQLKGEYSGKGYIKELSQILVLGGASDETVNRAIALRDIYMMEEKSLSLVPIGILALSRADNDVIISDMVEAYTFLQTQKGFRSIFADKQNLLLFAAAIVARGHEDVAKRGVLMAALLNGITHIYIAQQHSDVAVS